MLRLSAIPRPVDSAVLEVVDELITATKRHGKFNSCHEGYAILAEEVDELWDLVKLKSPNKAMLRLEATQVAAMAIRFMLDCTE